MSTFPNRDDKPPKTPVKRFLWFVARVLQTLLIVIVLYMLVIGALVCIWPAP